MHVTSAGWLYVIALVTPFWVGGIVFLLRTHPKKTAGRDVNARITRLYVLRWRFRSRWNDRRVEHELQEIVRQEARSKNLA